MRIYLDEDSIEGVLIALLRKEGHDVQVPAQVGLSGRSDPLQLLQAIREQRLLLTGNHTHFFELHRLIAEARGHHPGIAVVRRDNDPRRDITARGIVVAIAKLLESAAPIADEFHILNHWR